MDTAIVHGIKPEVVHGQSGQSIDYTQLKEATVVDQNGDEIVVVTHGPAIEVSTSVVPSVITSGPIVPVPVQRWTMAHVPLKSFLIKAFPFTINCPGCNKSFPCYYTPKGLKKIPSPDYYVHCIDDCTEYQAKNLIRSCDYCSFKFLDKEALGIHKNSCKSSNKRYLMQSKPDWMPVSILLTIVNYSRFDDTTACRACKQLFPCYRKGSKVVPSLEYYRHCIESCVEYQNKGWVKTCSNCRCKFLNNQALVQHRRGCHPRVV